MRKRRLGRTVTAENNASPYGKQHFAPPPRHSLAVWLASGLGVGLIAPAPGTFGALWGLPLAMACHALPGDAWGWIAAMAVIIVGVPVCGRAATDLARKDPGPVVWDKFATVPLVFLAVPPIWPWVALVGFALHRLFDITNCSISRSHGLVTAWNNYPAAGASCATT